VFSNIIKHSQATKVNIQIMGNKDHLSLFIEDNGIGFDNNNNNNGIGINNIKQRSKLFKGDMIIDTEVNKGTNITVTLKY
jgi:signal transduction histidine kinase